MSFWETRKVIVTGGAGFLGSFLVEKLRELGAGEVVIPRSEQYDLRDLRAVRQLFDEVVARPKAGRSKHTGSSVIVIHLAARVGGIGANQLHPAEYFYDNLMMGTQLLHESWNAGFEKFVAIGTVCAYPKFTPVPFKEESFWDGYPEETNAPYGLAKKMMLVQSQAYRQQYGFNSIYLLPINLYGPRDNFDLETSHVIPALVRKFTEARLVGTSDQTRSNGNDVGEPPVTVWGTGSPTREFLYVEDAAEGILRAAERYNGDAPVNLGSGMEISIRELVDRIARLTGFNGEVVWDTSRPDGQPRRSLDTSEAKRLFGFEASTEFEEGLRRTIDWYVRHRDSIEDRSAASAASSGLR